MAVAIQDAFSELRKHVRSVISEMFKSKLDQSELIRQEITRLSLELEALVAGQDLKLTADDNHDPVTISHEHGATTLSLPSSAGNRAVSEPGSPQVRDSLRLPQSEALAEGLSNCTLHGESHRSAPDIGPSQISSHDRSNSSVVSTGEQWPGNEETHQSTLQESSHNPEWPQSPPTPQGPSLPSSPIQYSPPQLPSAESPPSQSQPPQSAPQTTLQQSPHNPDWPPTPQGPSSPSSPIHSSPSQLPSAESPPSQSQPPQSTPQSTLQQSPHNPDWPPTPQGPSSPSSPIQYSPPQLSSAESPPSQSQAPQSPHQISYEMQDGIIRLFPTAEEWLDFPTILRYAQALGAEKVGIYKAVLPAGVVGLSKPLRYTKQKRFRYWACPQSNGTFGIRRKERKDAPKKSPKPADISSGTLAVQTFEELLHEKSGLKDVEYCPDIDVRRPKDRESLGLSTSPVWPLKGDRLPETKMRIPGLHWPYAYESYDSFGAPFAMHREDGDLYSINYLYEGDKYWFAIPPSHIELFEQKSRETTGCAQFLRHSATYFPTYILGGWNVPYKVVHQKAGEVIITCPQVYHQGFSAGYTFAEAANYADQNWNIQGYQECDSRYCPEGFIRKEMLEFRNEGEEQHSVESSEDDENHNSLAEETQTEARQDDNFAVKRRKLSPKKPVQSTTAVKERGASSNKAAKRKPVSQDTPNKIPKLQRSFTNNASAFFSGLIPIPKSIIQPANIYQIFTDRSGSSDSDTILLLTRLFFAIGSPDAFYQLRDACNASRQGKELAVSRSTNSIFEAVQALDQLDITVITASILRRFYLTVLVTQRYERERHHQSQRPKRLMGSQNFSYTKSGHDTGTATKQDCLERADTKALTGLMAEAYPSLKPTRKRNKVTDDEYQKKLSSLKVRLRDGRNWHTMQQRLPPGILALVPTRGDYQIQNREVERLSIPLFTLFLDVLIEFRGDFLHKVSELVSQHICEILYREDLNRKYVFETLDGNHLKQEHLDSNNFIKFCELES